MEPAALDMKYVSAANIALAAIVIVAYAAAGDLDVAWGMAIAAGFALSFMSARRIAFTHMPLNRPWLIVMPVALTALALFLLLNGWEKSARWIVVAMAYLAGSHLAYLRQRMTG